MHKTTRRNTHYSLVGAREGGATAKNQFVPGKQKQAHTHCTLVWQKNTVVRFSPSRELCIAGELYCYRCAVQFASRNVLPPAAGYGGSFSRSSPPPSLSLSLSGFFLLRCSVSLYLSSSSFFASSLSLARSFVHSPSSCAARRLARVRAFSLFSLVETERERGESSLLFSRRRVLLFPRLHFKRSRRGRGERERKRERVYIYKKE